MYIVFSKIKSCIKLLRKIISNFLTLIIFIFNNNSFCQTTHINWQPDNEINFYTYPALPHRVQGFAQDKYGYIWIGSSDGLYRFDGVSYQRFVHDDNNDNTIGANDCTPFIVDSQGMLWMRTDNGLSILNTSTYYFRNFNYSDSLFNDEITGCIEDKEKNIWISSIGTKNLTCYLPYSDKFIAYSVPDSIYWKGMRTFDIAAKADGKIYLASDNGVMLFNPKNGYYERIPARFPGHGDTLFYWGNQCIFIEDTGTLYSANFNNPAGKLALGILNDRLKRIEYEYADVETKNYFVLNITDKSDDELWLGINGGLIIYNKKTKHSKPCIHKADDLFSFPNDPDSPTNSTFKDRSGCFWFNSADKIVKADPLDNFVKSYNLEKLFDVKPNPGFNITSALKLHDENKLLISTWDGDGYYEVDLKKNELKKQKIFSDADQTRCEIQKIIKDDKGKLWSFTQHLILQYDSILQKFIPCKINPPLTCDPPGNFAFISMIEDSRGHFWLGTTRHGIYDFNPQDNTCINYSKKNYHSTYQKPDFINPCFEDEQQNIWFTSFDGVYLFNYKSKSFTRISYKPGAIKYNDGRDLLKDENGYIWRTTSGGGFQKYNPATKMFEVIDANIDTRQIKLEDMVEDNRGYIWISSDEEIYRFNPLNNTFLIPKQSMNIEMGNRMIGYCKEDGTLYTASRATLYETNTNQFNGNTNAPHIVFNNFKVLNQDTTFSKNLNDLSEITLPYDKNFISLEFVALNFSHSEKNQYAYKLDGIDKDWVINGNKNTVSYSKLTPGRYVFHVKASNNTGLWNDVGKSLSIIITPPWWQTWWFRLLVSVAVAVAVRYVVKIYTNRKLRLQKIEFEKQRALQDERSRISSDLHDDIGSNLTSIALLSEVAKSSTDKSLIEKNLNIISSSAGELVDKMSEIIWAMNSKNDTLENLIAYLREYASEYFEPYEIKLKIEFPETIPHHVFNSQLRRTIFLVVKESLHNIIKHACATDVKVKVKVKENFLTIEIIDNGKGFDADHIRRFGNGLQNMNNRLNEIKAHYEIKSEPGKGTITYLEIPILD